MTYSRAILIPQLVVDEAYRRFPYMDCCGKPWRQCQCEKPGKLTIGIGRNLDDVGITRPEAEYLCAHDLDGCERDLDRNVPWWRAMSEPRQRGLVNMCFNMGWPVLRQFHTTLGHLQAGRYADAAGSALDSQWARQVGERAQRIAALFRGERVA